MDKDTAKGNVYGKKCKEEADDGQERITSPQWKEFYADDAYVFPELYSIRISFADHPPQYFTGNSGRFTNRKVDIVMPIEAFIDFVSYLVGIVETLKEPAKTSESEEQKKKSQ